MERALSHLPKALALLSPLVLALLLGWVGTSYRPYTDRWDEYLQPVSVGSAARLERVLADLDYFWPLRPGVAVPRVAVDPLPDDFAAIRNVNRKKSLFFRALLPIILAENRRIGHQRLFLQDLDRAGVPEPGSPERRALERLMEQYRVDGDPGSAAVRATLLRRVDRVPTALALAQAANESAWGTSRFARLGNNLFGQWTYEAGQGIVPAARTEGRTHAVRKFPSVRQSVRAYMYNLNVGHAYQGLREIRAGMRRDGSALDPLALAAGLERYSARGEAYIEELRTMIRGNGLTVLSEVELRESAPRMVLAPLRAVESTGG